MVKGQQVPLIDIPKPDNNFIIIENLARDRQSCRIFHVISSLYNNLLKIGRGHDCNIRINDISVSRCHAFIKMENGLFYLEDNNSKFGTLILVKGGLILNPDANLSVQIGRTVISFAIKTKITQLSNTQKNPLYKEENLVALDDYDKIEFSLHKRDANKSKHLINIFDNLTLANIPNCDNNNEVNNKKAHYSSKDDECNIREYTT